MLKVFLYYMLIINIITFFMYLIDKKKAKKNARRIPEKVLLGLSILGGALGGLLSMYIFRHKTKHWYFVLINIVFTIFYIGLYLMNTTLNLF